MRPKSKSILPPEVECFEWDLATAPLPESAFADVMYVIHLAGLVGEHSYDELVKNNAYATKNLLLHCPSSVQKIAIASSISIYGKQPEIVDETFATSPKSAYGKSKLLAEEFAHDFCPALPIIFLRFGMVYGPGFEEGYFTVFNYLKKGKMQILGNGKTGFLLCILSTLHRLFCLPLIPKLSLAVHTTLSA